MGSKGTGKATLFRQLKFLSLGGGEQDHPLVVEQRSRYVSHVLYTAQQSVEVIITTLGLSFDRVKVEAKLLNRDKLSSVGDCSLVELWQLVTAPAVAQALLQHASQLAAADLHSAFSPLYFLTNLKRFAANDFCPSLEDVMRVCTNTPSLRQMEGDFAGSCLHIWSIPALLYLTQNVFFQAVARLSGEGVLAVTVNLAGFDEVVDSDDGTTALHQALDLW
eukprot:CAMPEP_0175126744 /NCGR_PEP_ID=MMETSP0087-20121206/4023_1 /TAXON_ID=136419 /ORGANISM="Unknown Unknown, Strain D1" /LENGTH=219 /DNA_ID=CAMNT_0016408689 /DNA_START=77 /DNA_END=733 /DNA_ORIENTATION=-